MEPAGGAKPDAAIDGARSNAMVGRPSTSASHGTVTAAGLTAGGRRDRWCDAGRSHPAANRTSPRGSQGAAAP